MKKDFITRPFLKGLSIVLPILISLYLVAWVIITAEKIVKGLLTIFIPEDLYLPGLGLVIFIILVYFIGLLMYPWFTRKIVGSVQNILKKIPVVKSVYSMITDLYNVVGGDFARELGSPVMIDIPNTDMKALGFVTRRERGDLSPDIMPDDHVAVYVQWGYNVGGLTFVIPKNQVTETNLTTEQGLKMALTSFISTGTPRSGKEES